MKRKMVDIRLTEVDLKFLLKHLQDRQAAIKKEFETSLFPEHHRPTLQQERASIYDVEEALRNQAVRARII